MRLFPRFDSHWKQRTARILAVLAFAGMSVSAFAQYGPYSPPNEPARWGYQAGQADGTRDRDTGHSFRPTHDDGYKHVPSSRGVPLPRDEFKHIYRDAYMRGYEAAYEA